MNRLSSPDARRERSSLPREAAAYDGVAAPALADRLGVAGVHLFDQIGSTLDAAHALAPDAPSGTLVLADEQTAGRGQRGRRWASPAGAGIWLTLIERPTDARALDVLPLRCGLYAAEALASLAPGPVSVKWPNDLLVDERKLAGILIETRWRGTAPDWVAVGFGVNVMAPAIPTRTGLRDGVTRLEALDLLVPALRRAAAAAKQLTDDEMRRWQSRDMAANRLISSPVEGRVIGLSHAGQLLVSTPDGAVTRHRTGSLIFVDRPV